MMQLIEKGLILISDPVCDYIEEFREMHVKGDNGELKKAETTMTIRHLMTMTANKICSWQRDRPRLLFAPAPALFFHEIHAPPYDV